ncbi:MAG TPA: diguanylate cyclase [Fimbriimonas sp.]|nr:diguanylate cyclase [Fimbriimonas sp.]
MIVKAPATDLERLNVLERLQILDTPEEQIYQDAAFLAAQICGTPMALISLIDKDRQWFKARVGVEMPETPLSLSFCTHAIQESKPLVVQDATRDQRFSTNPLVKGEFNLRFYAGAQIYADNVAVGTLSVLAREPRSISREQMRALEMLARQVSANLQLRLHAQLVASREEELRNALRYSDELATLLVHSAKRFENLFYGLPVACVTIDLEGRVVEWNNAAEGLFGYSAAEMVGQEVVRLLDEEDRKLGRQRFMEIVRNGGFRQISERYAVRKDGSRIWIMASALPLHGPDGKLNGIISTSIDITRRRAAELHLMETNRLIEEQRAALAQANERLEALSLTDSMTGLPNRRSFLSFLNTAFAESQRTGRPLSVILIDVDRFKSFNDQFGHPEGDIVLQEVSNILARSVRQSDFVARFGGEEFVVVLPETPASGALKAAETLREAIEQGDWPKRSITASLGIATTSLRTDSSDSLVRRADEALYAAKAAGRNRVMASPASTLV